jgi:hypothetical protein
VYRQFKTVEEMIDDAKAVIDAKRFEDPAQGVLFVEAAKPPGLNGAESKVPRIKSSRAKKTAEPTSVPGEGV